MATKRTSPKPERPTHSIPEKRADIAALERRIREVEAFDHGAVTQRFAGDHQTTVLQTAIDETLADVFGKGSEDYDRYSNAADLDDGPIPAMDLGFGGQYHGPDRAEAQRYAAAGKQRALALLQQAVRRLTEEIERDQSISSMASTTARPAAAALGRAGSTMPASQKVFIVHGHDQEMLQTVARFIERLAIKVVILHEQPNMGRTLIEKFEAHGEECGFAIILMSPDDEGRAKNSITPTTHSRARQNVVLELGYFVGKLGRSRVCALKRGDLEMPSDVIGVVYTSYDDAGAWKQGLAKELQAAGFTVDWNKVMGAN